MRTPRLLRRAPFLLLGALALPFPLPFPLPLPLGAQTPPTEAGPDPAERPRAELAVIGTVTDAATRQGIALALVRLVPLGSGGASGDTLSRDAAGPPAPTRSDTLPLVPREARTDTEGRYRIEGLHPGRHRLEVEALGYGPAQEEIRVAGASPMEIRVALQPSALALAPVVVTSIRSPRLDGYGFYDRRARGLGTYLDRDQIVDRFPGQVSDLFRAMAGVQVRPTGRGTASILTMRGGCLPDLVVDGMNLGTRGSVDEFLVWSDLEGVEVYRGATAPVQYTRSPCGAVLFWTADPEARRGTAPLSWRRIFLAAGFVALAILLTR